MKYCFASNEEKSRFADANRGAIPLVGAAGATVLTGVHIRPVRGPSFMVCDGCVGSSKDINPAKSASYNWDEAGNSVSFNLNLTAGTDPAVDCQA